MCLRPAWANVYWVPGQLCSSFPKECLMTWVSSTPSLGVLAPLITWPFIFLSLQPQPADHNLQASYDWTVFSRKQWIHSSGGVSISLCSYSGRVSWELGDMNSKHNLLGCFCCFGLRVCLEVDWEEFCFSVSTCLVRGWGVERCYRMWGCYQSPLKSPFCWDIHLAHKLCSD